MMSTISALLDRIEAIAVVLGFSLSFMTALELTMARSRYSVSGRLKGLMFWAIWLAASAVAYGIFRAIWSALGIKPLVVIPMSAHWAGPLAVLVGPLLGSIIYDFFFYWCHRAQHRWLWRFHAVHHSIRDVSAVNSYHHISEPIVQILLITIPSSLIAVDAAPVVPAMMVLLYLQTSFIHSPTSLHLGPLRWLFVDNRFHRIHHSVEEQHFDHNFGAMTTIWDRMFGTAWMPAKDEWPDTGIVDIDQPRTVGDWVSLPFRYPKQDTVTDSVPLTTTA